jgi:hypothetical protein
MSFLSTYDTLPDEKKAPFLLGELKKDPDLVFAELRQNRPILLAPAGPPLGVPLALVTLYADVTEALNRWDVFTVRPYARAMDPSVGPFMLARDDDALHEREKGIMWAMLPREDMPLIRRMATDIAAEALKPLLPAGEADLVAPIGRGVAVNLVARYFGFPGPDIATLLRWSYWTQYDMFHNPTARPDIHAQCVKAGQEMHAWLPGFLAQRRAAPDLATAHDTVSRLLRTTFPDDIGWDEERLLSNIMGLLVGAVETSNAAIIQALNQMFLRPEVLERAKAAAANNDPELDALVWEALRFDPINPFVGRLSVADHVLAAGSPHATRIAKGTLTLISGRSAMQDPATFPEPNAIRTNRPQATYTHLGYGPHTCLGKGVGLELVPAAIQQVLLLPNLRRADGAKGQIDQKGGPFPESFTVAFG